MAGHQKREYSRISRGLKNSLFLISILILACGRRGDPMMPQHYTIAVVEELNAVVKDTSVHLTWRMPEGTKFPRESLKGFVIFRAEVPAGTTLKECDCLFRSLDFVKPEGDEPFEYVDRDVVKGSTYAYKVVVMDKNSMMGDDSPTILIKVK